MTWLFLILALFISSTAEAARRWVNVTGTPSAGGGCNGTNRVVDESDTADPGSYQTFAQAKACMAAGDILRMKSGNYRPLNIQGLPSGSSGNPTTVEMEGGVIVSHIYARGDDEAVRN